MPLAASWVDVAMTPLLAALLAQLVRVDLQDGRLPDRLNLPLLGVGLGLSTWRAGGVPEAAILGAAGGFLVFWAIGASHYRLRASEGLGLGDAKLLAAAGAWLGWRPLPTLVLGAALGALAWAAASGRRGPLAFGPWLAAAFLGLWLMCLGSMTETFRLPGS